MNNWKFRSEPNVRTLIQQSEKMFFSIEQTGFQLKSWLTCIIYFTCKSEIFDHDDESSGYFKQVELFFPNTIDDHQIIENFFFITHLNMTKVDEKQWLNSNKRNCANSSSKLLLSADIIGSETLRAAGNLGREKPGKRRN